MNHEFDIRKFVSESVYGTHMINVGVRENEAADRDAQSSRRSENAGNRSGKAGIHERESIVFSDQEAIDHAEASQTEQVLCFLYKLHTNPREIQ